MNSKSPIETLILRGRIIPASREANSGDVMKNFEKNKALCRETTQNSSGSKSEDLSVENKIILGNSSNCRLVSGNSGFPKKCVCGSDVKIFTSESKDNPGRPYFRCTYSRAKGHLFKWVEDAMYEEVVAMKDEGSVVNELRLQVENMKEEVQGCKNAMRKLKRRTIVLFICFCIVAIVIIYQMMFEQDQSSLGFGSKTM